ncbi:MULTISPECIES: hypothetical protein [unclassified Streptomyces]|uniref:hypothetical protein n=1 Tax=unclassified Streptomyces TaxID=2593676 RepID=UPI002E1013A2|nr:hypothetical protein OG457_47560 [Streptomyces sp. NBC_01207]WTA16683.1 hypothetical protein OG365_00545 [Streptomyces sp. NBC_00853]
MSPQREIDEHTAGGQLALFLVGLVRGASVRELADRFGRSSSTWGNYLNGAQLIPRQLVGNLVESFTTPGVVRNTKASRAWELWAAADAERRALRTPSGGGLVPPHQRRDDALQQVIKYQAVAANAEKHLAELRPMLAYTQSRLENAELQLKLVGEREQGRVGRQLGQAKERLSRVRVQQERARNRRMTAEEQQEFWMTEALTAQGEIRRLEREAQDLVVPQTILEPARRNEADVVEDSDFETRLEHITAEGLEDEALIDEDLQPAAPSDPEGDDGIRDLPAVTVQSVSNPVLDKTAASTDVQRQAAPASVARVLRMIGLTLHLDPELERAVQSAPAEPRLSPGRNVLMYLGIIRSPEEPPEVVETWMRILMQVPLLIITVFLYIVAQEVAGRPDADRWGGVVVGTVLCLPLLYGALRIARLPKVPARILAVLLHTAWSVLLLLDRLPWPAPDFGSR